MQLVSRFAGPLTKVSDNSFGHAEWKSGPVDLAPFTQIIRSITFDVSGRAGNFDARMRDFLPAADDALEAHAVLLLSRKKWLEEHIFSAWQEFSHAVGFFDVLDDEFGIFKGPDQPYWIVDAREKGRIMRALTSPEEVWPFVSHESLVCEMRGDDLVITHYLNCVWEQEHGLTLFERGGALDFA